MFLTKTDMNVNLHSGNAIKWVWELHNMVNEKLGHPKLDLLQFEYRVRSRTYMGGPDNLYDFLFILAMNYDPADKFKRKYMYVFHEALGCVIPYDHASRALMYGKLTPKDLETQEAYIDWLYKSRTSYLARCKSKLRLLSKEEYKNMGRLAKA